MRPGRAARAALRASALMPRRGGPRVVGVVHLRRVPGLSPDAAAQWRDETIGLAAFGRALAELIRAGDPSIGLLRRGRNRRRASGAPPCARSAEPSERPPDPRQNPNRALATSHSSQRQSKGLAHVAGNRYGTPPTCVRSDAAGTAGGRHPANTRRNFPKTIANPTSDHDFAPLSRPPARPYKGPRRHTQP